MGRWPGSVGAESGNVLQLGVAMSRVFCRAASRVTHVARRIPGDYLSDSLSIRGHLSDEIRLLPRLNRVSGSESRSLYERTRSIHSSHAMSSFAGRTSYFVLDATGDPKDARVGLTEEARATELTSRGRNH